LAGHGAASVNLYSSTQTGGVPLTLTETARPGLFRGSLGVIASTNPPTTGKLRVKNGDQLWVDYFDASSNATIRATAVVDTVKPVISNVVAEPDYEESTVTWNTSEQADSLVQFGESAFLGPHRFRFCS